MRMNAIMICCSLIGAIFANPITISIDLDSPEQQTNSTEILLVAQSSGNGTSDVQSSESESSESVESESSDDTSEESDSVESNETELLVETRDDSMGSEENVRKSWVRVFATVVRDTSTEDNSTEVNGQPESLNNKVEQTIQPPTMKTLKQSSKAKMALVQKVTAESDSSSESAESTALVTFTVDSSQSSSSESNETSSEASDSDSASNSAQSSESSEEDSNSDSTELSPIKDCVNGTQSCESEEYFFQDIGDDANYSVDNLMVPDEDDRELSLRR